MTEWTPVEGRPGLSVRLARKPSGRTVVVGVKLEADAVTADMLRRIPLAAIEVAANAAPAPTFPALSRSAFATAEEFSAAVAEQYRAWAAIVPNPVAMIATNSGQKSATVHTWIREARLRGLLPAATKRKA